MTQELRQDTRDRISDSFKQLVVTKGFEKMIVKDITDGAGLARPTFYIYFQDKYEVAEYIFDRDVGDIVRPLLENGFVREAFLSLLVRMDKDKEYYRRMYKVDGQNAFSQIMHKCFMQDMIKVVARKRAGAETENRLFTPENIAEYLFNIFRFVIARWLERSEDDVTINTAMEGYDIMTSHTINDILGDDPRA